MYAFKVHYVAALGGKIYSSWYVCQTILDFLGQNPTHGKWLTNANNYALEKEKNP